MRIDDRPSLNQEKRKSTRGSEVMVQIILVGDRLSLTTVAEFGAVFIGPECPDDGPAWRRDGLLRTCPCGKHFSVREET